ncbi:MAG TPA: helical backbone metal receptor [Burkholderiales bacterium]|jgi:ABC-type Fe3+-hydroxamate transport system substrate-binding protein|nr:helical backbone metal receptor [Burkholderiales bacterium]
MADDPQLVDAAGTLHVPAGEGARIACLVPSITELLCDLGLAPQLVARTGFCIHPKELVAAIPKVGGTKDVDLEKLRALKPTHVVLNIDENTKPAAETLATFVPHLVVTHPQAPEDNLALYRLLGGLFGRRQQAEALCGELEAALEEARADAAPRASATVLYLIWKDPWMTVSPDTYIARTLATAGWRVPPQAAAARYPEVELPGAAQAAEWVLLSTEPYMFRPRHLAELGALLPGKRIALIDGEMTSWYGSRAIAGLRYLPRLRAQLEAASSAGGNAL